MTPYYSDDSVTIYHDDIRSGIPRRDDSVSCAVTSPPYCEIAATRLSQCAMDFGGAA